MKKIYDLITLKMSTIVVIIIKLNGNFSPIFANLLHHDLLINADFCYLLLIFLFIDRMAGQLPIRYCVLSVGSISECSMSCP